MSHYETLLAELRTVDQKMLRRIDRKRRPPESMPNQVWYGSDIPRDMIDQLMEHGNYKMIEGTPMVYALYEKYGREFSALLYTTVALYGTDDIVAHGYDGMPQYPLRYADYSEVCSTWDHGFFDYNIYLIRKDGSRYWLRTRALPVFLYCIISRCVDYVREHGPIEENPPRLRTAVEDKLHEAVQRLFPKDPEPHEWFDLFPEFEGFTPPPLQPPREPDQPQPVGSSEYSNQAISRMAEYRRCLSRKDLTAARSCLNKAMELGHGDAAWILGKLLADKDYASAVPHYMKAYANGSKEGAEAVETFTVAGAIAYFRNDHDQKQWEDAMLTAVGFGGTRPLMLMADYYLNGDDGMQKDVDRGLWCLELAAERGNVSAMFRLGTYLATSKSEEDRERGKKYLTRAAENGSEDAMAILMVPFGLKSLEDWQIARYWGHQYFTRARAWSEKASIAQLMLGLASSPKEFALWHALLQRYTMD